MLLHRALKYGSDDDSVDALVEEITGWIGAEVRRYTTYLGGYFKSLAFSVGSWTKDSTARPVFRPRRLPPG